jgi:hypothetical protein
MKYTVQLHADSGNWACPQPDDVRHAYSKQQAADLLTDWAETVGRYDDERCASALVWCGHLDDVTDAYPDFELTLGPRLGVRWNRC